MKLLQEMREVWNGERVPDGWTVKQAWCCYQRTYRNTIIVGWIVLVKGILLIRFV